MATVPSEYPHARRSPEGDSALHVTLGAGLRDDAAPPHVPVTMPRMPVAEDAVLYDAPPSDANGESTTVRLRWGAARVAVTEQAGARTGSEGREGGHGSLRARGSWGAS